MNNTSLLSWSLIKAISVIKLLFKIFVLPSFDLLTLEKKKLVPDLFIGILSLELNFKL
jgi:hypothetical protein